MKAHPELQDMVLANNTRLSVQPVKEKEWNMICNLAGVDALKIVKKLNYFLRVDIKSE